MNSSSFKILGLLSVILKVYAFLTLFLMAVGLVGIVMTQEMAGPQKFQVVMNMVLGGTLFFLVLYTLSDLVRLLLKIESQLSKENP